MLLSVASLSSGADLAKSAPPPPGTKSEETDTLANATANPDDGGMAEKSGPAQRREVLHVNAHTDQTIRLPQASAPLSSRVPNGVTVAAKPRPRPMPPTALRIRSVK
jgi:hypothetical protein